MTTWLDAAGQPVPGADAFGLMGIINVTPDSFHDGGRYEEPGAAAAQACRLVEAGADILDIGAESTRPYSSGISQELECERLLPALGHIRKLLPDVVLSVDTRHSRTARLAIEAGCGIVNDISACRHDPALLEVLAQYRPGYVLMHCQGEPETMQASPAYTNVIDEIKSFFDFWLGRLTGAGLPEDRIALDPGIGFGKTVDHNLALLSHIGEFMDFGRPLLVGLSMKSLFSMLPGVAAGDAGEATAVAAALLFTKGVVWHRVHDVARVRRALILAGAMQA